LFCISCREIRNNTKLAGDAIANVHKSLFKRLMSNQSIRLTSAKMDSIWQPNIKYVVLLPSLVTKHRKIILNTLHDFTKENTILVTADSTFVNDFGAYNYFYEKADVGFHFILPPENDYVYILELNQKKGKQGSVYYVTFERRF
jgi:hypothetical protein